MVDKLLARNFTTIYFSTINDGNRWDDPSKSKNYSNFINYAHSKGMKVFGVTLESPIYLFKSEQHLRGEFGNFINHTKGIFDSYIIDVEPHTTTNLFGKKYPPFEENKCMYFNRYVNMSTILRSVADDYDVKYIDTLPPWYHEAMKHCEINGGFNALSSHSINLMAYTSTVEEALHEISSVMLEVTKPYVVNIKVTSGQGDSTLEKQDIPGAIFTLTEENSLPIGMYEATTLMRLPIDLFTSHLE